MVTDKDGDRLLRAAHAWTHTTDAQTRRERSYRKYVVAAIDGDYISAPPDSLTPERVHAVANVCAALGLPPVGVRCIELWLMEYTIPEIACELGIKSTSVSSHICRVRKRLAGEIEQHTYGDVCRISNLWSVMQAAHMLELRSWWPRFADALAASKKKPRL